VEYGPGVGTFCQPVLDRLRRDARLIVIDTNPDFITYLARTIGDSRFIAVHGSAADVESIVRQHGYDHADYVLSGLPFTTCPKAWGRRSWPPRSACCARAGFLSISTRRARALMSRYFHRIDKGSSRSTCPLRDLVGLEGLTMERLRSIVGKRPLFHRSGRHRERAGQVARSAARGCPPASPRNRSSPRH
jgi:hypothetical protein